MVKFGVAVKAFIVNDKDELLLIKRRPNDCHQPCTWEIPGGRLDEGESPFEGLKRETKEETNIDIEIKEPLGIHHFTRDDKQIITMIVFLCKIISTDLNEIKLSEEHTEFQWVGMDVALDKVHSAFQNEIKVYKKHFSKQ